MRITNFIKNHPSILLSLLLISTMISIILIEAKVYAVAKGNKVCGCSSRQICDFDYDYEDGDYKCAEGDRGCYCPWKKEFKHCDKDYYKKCIKISGSGCCEPQDCNPPCEPTSCGTCRKYTLATQQCTGAPGGGHEVCGDCNYVVKEI